MAYVLGQVQNAEAVAELRRVLADEGEHAMVRHEAAEALGAIAQPECVEALRRHLQDSCRPVAQSCEIALDILDYEQSGDFQYAAVA